MKSIKKLFLLLLLVGLIAAVVFYFRDTEGPQVSFAPESGSLSNKTSLSLNLSDSGMGLRQVQVTVLQDGQRIPLASKTFVARTENATLGLDLSSIKLKQGGMQIEVLATDQSIYHLGKGNQSQQVFQYSYDTRPPIISILSKAHNMTKGGSGLVTFRLNEEVEKTGVTVGELFFPAHLQDTGVYACLFAYPYDMKESDFVPRVTATDLAGNERQAGFYYRANNRKYRTRKINLSDKFLQQKTPEFESLVPEAGEPIDTFLYVNRQIRQENRNQMTKLARQTTSYPLWQGSFLSLPNSSALALFADHRSYYYQGKKVDTAVHLGYDQASVAQAEIPAGNTGDIIWADYLGIYGLCVVIDHGLGLQTLYAHMSQLDVQVGDTVTRGQVIGRSGSTGMAGGDHLHFGVFVAGVAVQPLEWWDKNWLKNNITSKFEPN